MTKAKKMKAARKAEAVKQLREEYGAEAMKTEDRWGETKTGWWLDGMWLAPTNDPEHALRLIQGGG